MAGSEKTNTTSTHLRCRTLQVGLQRIGPPLPVGLADWTGQSEQAQLARLAMLALSRMIPVRGVWSRSRASPRAFGYSRCDLLRRHLIELNFAVRTGGAFYAEWPCPSLLPSWASREDNSRFNEKMVMMGGVYSVTPYEFGPGRRSAPRSSWFHAPPPPPIVQCSRQSLNAHHKKKGVRRQSVADMARARHTPHTHWVHDTHT
jgi:hypothetical protein